MTNLIKLNIVTREPFAGGYEFGESGPYERMRGRAHFAVDPDAPAQANVVDLSKAPRNGQGLVEFVADVFILKPCNPELGNGRLFYDLGNRGSMRCLQSFNDAPASNDPATLEHAGNGFLFRRGYTIVWSAWQGDLVPGNDRLLLDLPVATDNGAPLTGRVIQEYMVETQGVTTLPLSDSVATRCQPVASLDTTKARLTKRPYAYSTRQEVPPDAWSFATVKGGEGVDDKSAEIGIHPSDTDLYVSGGLTPGWLYELIYTARDPLVMGLGYVAVRDLISYLRSGTADAAGNANPLGVIDKVYCWGRSQTGRFIRDFLYRGFNADVSGRKVFDAVWPHASGGGLMWMNHRFANCSASAGCLHKEHFVFGDRFPFSYALSTDHLTGVQDAILKRPETDPLIFHTHTSTEYWERHGSLVHTDTRGNDLEQPDNVRIYFWSSSQHTADPLLKKPVTPPNASNPINVVHTTPLFRAALDALDDWASTGREPPDSRIPSRADGTLVDFETWRAGFPKIPAHIVPPGVSDLPLLDFGPDADDGLITNLPPKIKDRQGYAILVPKVDADGNDIAGVRAPMVAAPLATYTASNIRRRGPGHGTPIGLFGSTIMFPETHEDRQMTRDPRRSILERYKTAQGYVDAVRQAAVALVSERLMLEEDVERVVAMAADWGRSRHNMKM